MGEPMASAPTAESRVSRMALVSVGLTGFGYLWPLWVVLAQRQMDRLLDLGLASRLPFIVHTTLAMAFIARGFVPLLAIGLGALALEQIRRQPAQLRGAGVARVAIAASSLLLFWGWRFVSLAAGQWHFAPILALGLIAVVLGVVLRRRLEPVILGVPSNRLVLAAISVVAGAGSWLSVLALSLRLALGLLGFAFAILALIRSGGQRARLVTAATVVGLGLAVFGGLSGAWTSMAKFYDSTTCLGNLRELTRGLLWYAQDHDGLPTADKWCDDVLPYQPRRLFVCPGAPRLASGYAFNRALGGVKISENVVVGAYAETVELIENPSQVVVLFESVRRQRLWDSRDVALWAEMGGCCCSAGRKEMARKGAGRDVRGTRDWPDRPGEC